tara:strand:+ start:3098 stop:3418 length:321 start_codon:yes stop_codon:yes gene_type:complete
MRNKRKQTNKVDKSVNQKIHCKKRCLERFGFEPNRHTFREWVEAIQNGKAKPIYKQSQRVTIFDYNHYGHKMRLVYDNKRKVVCTTLTQDMDPRQEVVEQDWLDFL